MCLLSIIYIYSGHLSLYTRRLLALKLGQLIVAYARRCKIICEAIMNGIMGTLLCYIMSSTTGWSSGKIRWIAALEVPSTFQWVATYQLTVNKHVHNI